MRMLERIGACKRLGGCARSRFPPSPTGPATADDGPRRNDGAGRSRRRHDGSERGPAGGMMGQSGGMMGDKGGMMGGCSMMDGGMMGRGMHGMMMSSVPMMEGPACLYEGRPRHHGCPSLGVGGLCERRQGAANCHAEHA